MKNKLTPKDYDRWESPPGVFFAIEDTGEEEETQVNKFTITKTEPDKMLVFGWGNVAITKDGEQVTDLQGDVIDPDELEKAAYDHVLNFRNTGERHDPGLRRKGRLVESCVFTKEKQEAMGIPPGTVPEGWWVGYKIDDPDAWEKIKKGDYQMFSIEGKGQRTPIEKFNPNHCPNTGKFTSKGGASSGAAGSRLSIGYEEDEDDVEELGRDIVGGMTPGDVIQIKRIDRTGHLENESSFIMTSAGFGDYRNGEKTSGRGIGGRKEKYDGEDILRNIHMKHRYVKEGGRLDIRVYRDEKAAGIAKSYEEMRKFNPFHDAAGKFSNKHGFASYSANPNTRAGAMAIARSAAAGHGNTANVHRASYGENIRQNANWLGRGKQVKPGQQGNATLRQRVEPIAGLQGASATGASWQYQNQAQGRSTQPGKQPAQQTQAQQKPAQAQPQQPQQPAQNQQTPQPKPSTKPTDRTPVDGKDISATFKYDPNGNGNALDQVATQQGYTGKPTVITDKAEFSQRVAESGIMAYRTINSGTDVKTGAHKTSSQFIDDLKNGDEFSFNGRGGQAYGAGLYIAGATSTTKGKGPSRSATNAAKTDSKAYGGASSKTVSMTLDKSAKVGDYYSLWSEYRKIPTTTSHTKYGRDRDAGFAAFCASKGYDAVRSADAGIGCDYYIVYNRTKLVVLDS